MQARCFTLLPALCLVLALGVARPAAAKPKIVGVTTAGPSATFQQTGRQGGASIDAQLGTWTGGFGSEPYGDSVLSVTMDVHGEGGVTLNYQIQTTDIAFFDWLDIALITDAGTVPIVSGYNPNPSLFSLYVGPVVPLPIDLSAYKGQTVTLQIAAHQDGYGDQFQALITGLQTFGLDD